MSEQETAFLREIYSLTKSTVDDLNRLLFEKIPGETYTFRFTPDQLKILENLNLEPAEAELLKKALRIMAMKVVYDTLCVIDGIVYTEEKVGDLALIDRETGQNIADDFLYEAFVGVVIDHENEAGEHVFDPG